MNFDKIWKNTTGLIKNLLQIIKHSTPIAIHAVLILISSALISIILCLFFWEHSSPNIIKSFDEKGWLAFLELKDVFTRYIIIVIASVFIVRKLFPKCYPIRNVRFLIKQLRSEDKRTPATSVEELTQRIAGEKATQEIINEIQAKISSSTNSIERFITDNEKTLVINGDWGSGKTSSVIIAISNTAKNGALNKTNCRFIYESAFKYVSGFREFKKDILQLIQSILSEHNIAAPYIFHELLNNISPSNFGLPLNNLGDKISITEYIDKLNKKYDSQKYIRLWQPFKIILIIDDIDRLQGTDIIETLAFLSTIRRLKFIKIILPIERQAVIEHLKAEKIYKPEVYIKKYLPEQSEVTIVSSFELFKDIFTKRIHNDIDAELDKDQVRPILEIICVKVFSDKLKENMKAVGLNTLGSWHSGISSPPKELVVSGEYNSSYIFEARNYLTNSVPATRKSQLGYLQTSNDEFEALIYLLKYGNKRQPLENGNNPLRVDKELYEDCFRGWILQFSERKWSQVGATMRTVNDIYDALIKDMPPDYINRNLAPHEIFVKAYNKLLPKWPIYDADQFPSN